MKFFFTSALCLLAILQSCVPANNLTPDKIAKRIFNPAELEGIGKMINLVDSAVLAKTNETDINKSYHAYFNQLASYIKSKKDLYPPLLKDSVKFGFLETINKEAFSAVWRKDFAYTNTPGNRRGFEMLEINMGGKYMKYLQEIAASDPNYANIYKDLSMAGDFSPSIVVGFLMNNKDFDFSSYKNRLWVTVFLLRHSEPIKIDGQQ